MRSWSFFFPVRPSPDLIHHPLYGNLSLLTMPPCPFLVAGVSSDLLPTCFLFKQLYSLPVLFLSGKLPISPLTPHPPWLPDSHPTLVMTHISNHSLCPADLSLNHFQATCWVFFFSLLKNHFFWTIIDIQRIVHAKYIFFGKSNHTSTPVVATDAITMINIAITTKNFLLNPPTLPQRSPLSPDLQTRICFLALQLDFLESYRNRIRQCIPVLFGFCHSI